MLIASIRYIYNIFILLAFNWTPICPVVTLHSKVIPVLPTRTVWIISKTEKRDFRSYILTKCRQDVPAAAIHSELVVAWGDQAPCIRTVQNWIARFNAGDESTEDKPRVGRPITATCTANVDRVQVLIDDDPHISFTLLEAETGLCRGSLQRIVHDCLRIRKVSSRWVPHTLTVAQNMVVWSFHRWRVVVLP